MFLRARNPFLFKLRIKFPEGALSDKYLIWKFKVVEISWHCIKYLIPLCLFTISKPNILFIWRNFHSHIETLRCHFKHEAEALWKVKLKRHQMWILQLENCHKIPSHQPEYQNSSCSFHEIGYKTVQFSPYESNINNLEAMKFLVCVLFLSAAKLFLHRIISEFSCFLPDFSPRSYSPIYSSASEVIQVMENRRALCMWNSTIMVSNANTVNITSIWTLNHFHFSCRSRYLRF